MKKIIVTLYFQGVGHTFIDLIPAHNTTGAKLTTSGAVNFDIPAGNYSLNLQGSISRPGASITVADGANVVATKALPASYFATHVMFSV
jgi:hypothetical protein